MLLLISLEWSCSRYILGARKINPNMVWIITNNNLKGRSELCQRSIVQF